MSLNCCGFFSARLFLAAMLLSIVPGLVQADQGAAAGDEHISTVVLSGESQTLESVELGLAGDLEMQKLGCEKIVSKLTQIEGELVYRCFSGGASAVMRGIRSAIGATKKPVQVAVSSSSTVSCSAGCYYRNCPSPSGPPLCCRAPSFQIKC